MIHQLTDNAIAVEVPKETGRVIVRATDHCDYNSISCFDKWTEKEKVIIFQKGSGWQFLSLLSDMDEGKAGEIVEELWLNEWVNYNTFTDTEPTALSSFQTLTQSKGIDTNKQWAVLIKKLLYEN